MKPVYQHDCDACVFLGTVLGDADYPYDLYACVGPSNTVIARYGNYGWQYQSGIALAPHVPAINAALALAKWRGLV